MSNPHAVALGRLGGLAGRGTAKARGPMPPSVRTLGALARMARAGSDAARIEAAVARALAAGATQEQVDRARAV
jgi:alkylhydroperoxidase/carboxymuconolactone decarboxylase family protein YurZ